MNRSIHRPSPHLNPLKHRNFACALRGEKPGRRLAQLAACTRDDDFSFHTSPLAGTFLKDTLDDRYRGKNIRPTSIEGQVREHLRGLRFR